MLAKDSWLERTITSHIGQFIAVCPPFDSHGLCGLAALLSLIARALHRSKIDIVAKVGGEVMNDQEAVAQVLTAQQAQAVKEQLKGAGAELMRLFDARGVPTMAGGRGPIDELVGLFRSLFKVVVARQQLPGRRRRTCDGLTADDLADAMTDGRPLRPAVLHAL